MSLIRSRVYELEKRRLTKVHINQELHGHREGRVFLAVKNGILGPLLREGAFHVHNFCVCGVLCIFDVMWCRLFPHLHGFPLFYVGVVFVQERDEKRGSQIVTGDRSERIRTYNYPQGRVTDHRAGISKHSIEKMLEGVYLSELVRMNLLHEKCGFRHLHRI
jgi:hypothetical protein